VTARGAANPVSRRLITNILRELREEGPVTPVSVRLVGGGAGDVAREFSLDVASPEDASGTLILVGNLERPSIESEEIRTAVRAGATVLLLPDAKEPTAAAFGLKLSEQTFFRGELRRRSMIPGLGSSDLYFKTDVTADVAVAGDGWEEEIAPGLLVSRKLGRGRLFAWRLPLLDPTTRAGIKTMRCWNALFSSLNVSRGSDPEAIAGQSVRYLDSPWEQIPPFINW